MLAFSFWQVYFHTSSLRNIQFQEAERIEGKTTYFYSNYFCHQYPRAYCLSEHKLHNAI